jgi:hypothetical protein
MASNPPADRPEKKDNPVKTLVGDSLYKALAMLADADDRCLSEYVERVLHRHVFGNLPRRPSDQEGPNRD